MPQYTYIAMDGKGKEQKGKIMAANEEAVMAALRAKGMFPTSIKLEVGKDAAKKMSSKGGAKSKGCTAFDGFSGFTEYCPDNRVFRLFFKRMQ